MRRGEINRKMALVRNRRMATSTMPMAATVWSGRTASAPITPTTLSEDRTTFDSQTN